MKKLLVLALALISMCALVLGCGSTQNQAAKTVSTDGSTSMEKVIGLLSEDYMNQHSDVKVTYNPTGSSAGIKAVSEGRTDIGLSSRNLTDKEKETLTETVVGIDGIAIITNKENPVQNLDLETLAKVYTGQITNWKELGGKDAPIVLIGREAASGTRDGFESITKTKGQNQYTQELTSTGDVIQTVSSNPNAIGYASLASVKDSVSVLAINGVKPSKATIQDGSYKIQRDFVLVTLKGKALSEEAQKFFDYATSPSIVGILEKAGVIPVK